MAKFTVEIKTLLDGGFDFGLKDYPIYNEEHRKVLNNKILSHYYNREIAFETEGLFKLKLNNKMNEIMPYYNQLYKSEDVKFNPLYNVEIHETYSHEVKGSQKQVEENVNKLNGNQTEKSNFESENEINSENTNTTDMVDTTVTNELPQNDLTYDDIRENKFATNTGNNKKDGVVEDKGTSTSNETSTQNNEINNTSLSEGNTKVNADTTQTETYTKLTEGSSAGLPFSKAIKQWRQIMLNIDMQIIEELEELFIQLW